MDIDDLISTQTLEAEPFPVYVVDPLGCLSWANQAWDVEAAKAYGPLFRVIKGTPWLHHIAGHELRTWHEDLFYRVLTRGVGETHTCDCNTPDRFRLFAARFEPLATRHAPGAVHLLVATFKIADAPIGERYTIGPPDRQRYVGAEGLLLQCGGCRRVHVAGSVSPRIWEFVPEYVSSPRIDVSHGLCELCRELFYGSGRRHAPG